MWLEYQLGYITVFQPNNRSLIFTTSKIATLPPVILGMLHDSSDRRL